MSSFKHAEARAVREILPADRVVFLDDDWLVRDQSFGWCWNATEDPVWQFGHSWLRPADLISVFFRPIVRPQPSPEPPRTVILQPNSTLGNAYQRLGQAEAEATLNGALWPLPVRWVNHPIAEQVADQKIYHLTLARRLGLRVPRTVISTEPDRLIDFWHELSGQVVTKAVSSRPSLLVSEALATRQVTRADLDTLRTAAPMVTLFQELIQAALDLRVTLVGDAVFPTAIYSQEGASPLDWRLDQAVRMAPFTLDQHVVDSLQQLRRTLGLSYGAVDMRLTPDGDVVFLEINAQGSYLFVEMIVGTPITRAIADLLLTPLRPGEGVVLPRCCYD